MGCVIVVKKGFAPFISWVEKLCIPTLLVAAIFASSGCASNKLASASKCTSANEHTNQTTVPELYEAMNACTMKGNYKEASKHLLLARAYGDFDAMRVQDVTARNAPQNMERMYFNDMSIRKLKRLQGELDKISSSETEKQSFCMHLDRMGPPNYYPRYMLDYGVKPVQGSGLAPNFEPEKVWRGKVLATCLNTESKKVYPSPEAMGRREVLSFSRLMRSSKEIVVLAWSSDEKTVAVTPRGGKSYVHVFKQGDFFPTKLADAYGNDLISYDSNGLYLAATTHKFVGRNLFESVIIRDSKSNKILYNFSLPDSYLSNFEANNGRYKLEVTSIAFNPMSTNLIASFYALSFNGRLILREQYLCTFSLKDGAVSSVVKINSRLRNLKYSSDDNTLWGTRSLGLRSVFGRDLKPDDWDATTNQVFKRTWNYSIEGLNLKTKAVSKIVENIHGPYMRAVSFNSKFKLIATASSYGLALTRFFTKDLSISRTVKNKDPVRLWNLNGDLLYEIPAKSVRSLDISPDGKLLVVCPSVRRDHYVSLWDVSTGYQLQKVSFSKLARTGSVPVCVFSPNSNFLAVGEDNYIEIYNVKRNGK